MRTVLIVAIREILTLLRRPSFYAAALIAPLVVGVLFFGSSVLNAEFGDDPAAEPRLPRPAGYVDQAGVIGAIPEPLHPFFIPYADETTAAAALRADTIDSFFVLASDYPATGRVIRVAEQATFTGGSGADTRLFRAVLRANLAGDQRLAQRLDRPLDLQMRVVDSAGDAQDAARPDNPFGGISTSLALLLAFSIVNGGGWLIQAVAEEKENRTIEIMLTTLRPLHLMAGKLLGLGIIALLQLGFWLGLTRVGLSVGNSSGQIDAGSVPANLWGWLVLFFLLGFLLVGGLMMALGAVGASMRESGQISGFMTIPVVAPLWFAPAIAENPNGLLGLVLSLFPITAPVTMTLRLVEGMVPLWQVLLSVGLLAIGVVGAVWLAARLFRGTSLLTGVRPTPRALWRAVRAE